MLKIYFSDYFGVNKKLLSEYGAFNISLINDLPVFVDPFLIFNSDKPEYQRLHQSIIRYLVFLRDKALEGPAESGALKSWYHFKEIKQNWLGYSRTGNSGRGLGPKFAQDLNQNLYSIFSDFGEERITRGSHLEKVCLIGGGVGRDNISDFTTNLIKEYLLNYTENFATSYISKSLRKQVAVKKVCFNYETETWMPKRFDLPFMNDDYVLLTPKDILTKDDLWISRENMLDDYYEVVNTISNDQLRFEINNYFRSALPDKPKKADKQNAISKVFLQYPKLLDYYIRYKEDNGNEARMITDDKMVEVETQFVQQIENFVEVLNSTTDFYISPASTKEKLLTLKSFIETNENLNPFFLDMTSITRESPELTVITKLIWEASTENTNGLENSSSKKPPTFKLASNSQLERFIEKRIEKLNENEIIAIICLESFHMKEVLELLQDLKLKDHPNIVLINAAKSKKNTLPLFPNEQLDDIQDISVISKFKQEIFDSFDLNELYDLCLDLEIEYELFPRTKDAFIRELIKYQQRRKELKTLLDRCKKLRPKSNWPDQLAE